jgi:hypothetical protein
MVVILFGEGATELSEVRDPITPFSGGVPGKRLASQSSRWEATIRVGVRFWTP